MSSKIKQDGFTPSKKVGHFEKKEGRFYLRSVSIVLLWYLWVFYLRGKKF